MKEYVTPWLVVYSWVDADIVTASDPNDNNWEDDGDWIIGGSN